VSTAQPPFLIDTHCHLDFERYDEDRAAVLARARAAGVMAIVNPAVDLANCAVVCDLAAAESDIYAAVGIHPTSTVDFAPAQIAELRGLAGRTRVVAIGEIGLDYYWDRSPKEAQRRALLAQLDLAAELALPVIIHNRNASDDVLAILTDWVGGLPEDHPLRGRAGVLHSFSAPESAVEQTLALGFYIGITGPVTFKKADDLRHIVAGVPVERLLIETDGPFLTPHPYRGKRNEPAFVQYTADRIAALHRMSLEAFAAQASRNAIRLFDLPLVVPSESPVT
jgi:TatD DNase family protein